MKWFIRGLFLALIGLEAAAWSGVVNFRGPDFSWFGLIGTAAGVWLFLEALNAPPVIWAVVFGDTLLDALSDSFHFYSRWMNWDRVMHFMGGATAATVVLYIILRWLQNNQLSIPQRTFIVILAVLGLVSLLGLMYETWEYVTHFKYPLALGDGADTVDDQLFNLFGAGTVLLLAYAASLAKNAPWPALNISPESGIVREDAGH